MQEGSYSLLRIDPVLGVALRQSNGRKEKGDMGISLITGVNYT